ncbi:MAG: hypothetical protein GX652_10415 [Burkholderiaceae bacterium]|nr:hypothetical protein [Burkholderiaceae bacterium]
MNDSHAHFSPGSPAGMVIGFGRPGVSHLREPGKPTERRVVMALEERMWRDRREVACRQVPAARTLTGRLRARVRELAFRMQLGPVPDEAAGRDPENRF